MPACSCCPGWDFCRSRTRGWSAPSRRSSGSWWWTASSLRYRSSSGVDGLPGDEGAFLPCTLWLVAGLAKLGRTDEALEFFNRVVAVANDVGLWSEEYDTKRKRLVGNFPQAFTHVGFINSARVLAEAMGGSEPSASAPRPRSPRPLLRRPAESFAFAGPVRFRGLLFAALIGPWRAPGLIRPRPGRKNKPGPRGGC